MPKRRTFVSSELFHSPLPSDPDSRPGVSVSCAIHDRQLAFYTYVQQHAVLAAFAMKHTAAALLIAWVCLLPNSCCGQESPSFRSQVVLGPYISNKVAVESKTLDRAATNSGFHSIGVQELLQRDPDLVSGRRRC